MSVKKLAFLFLIYDEINNEDVWHSFFEHADPNKYCIYIHYKTQNPLKWFESCKLKNCIETKYVIDTSIAKAHNLLIAEALRDPDVFKTINLSQSCIPFKSFDHVYDMLSKDGDSHFNLMPMSDWSIAVTWPALKYVPREEIHKAANWFILNRQHAECCFQHLEYFEYFHSVQSPEEFLYITLLKKFLPENINCTNYSAEGATTFTNWDANWGMVYKFPVFASIKNYSQISCQEIEYLMSSRCLFGRKFVKNCIVGESTILSCYKQYMDHIMGKSSIEN